MNIEFLKQSAVAKIISSDVDNMQEVIYQEINNIISIVGSYSELKGYNEAMKELAHSLGINGL